MKLGSCLKKGIKELFPSQYNYLLKIVKKYKLSKNEKYVEAKSKACTNASINDISYLYDTYEAPFMKEPEEFYEAALKDDIEERSIKWFDDDTNTPIFICAVKDDLQRVRIQVEYYRKLGVTKFVYIDNGSKDGTYEWLYEQKDVNLYYTAARYKAIRRVTWIRKITDIYGYNRWYLICDADELFAYPNCEKWKINDYVSYLESQNMTSICAMLLDMYAKGKILSEEKLDDETLYNEYRYFDCQDYTSVFREGGLNIYGGSRTRVFSVKGQFNNYLAKYPLVKLQRDDLRLDHKLYRKGLGIDKQLHAVLKHYKFLPEDSAKYNEIIKLGNYSNGSAEYKAYMAALKENPELSFYYSKSEEWDNSFKLYKINIFDSEFYEEAK